MRLHSFRKAAIARVANVALASIGLTASASSMVDCGGSQGRLGTVFSTDWEDDQGKSISALRAELEKQPIPRGAAVAIGTNDAGIVGVSLNGGDPWKFPHALATRPRVAGSVVVGEGGGELFALDATTGHHLWTRPLTGHLRGIGDDGKTTVVSLTGVGDNGGTVLAVERGGNVVRQLEAKPTVGIPAILGSYLFLPWDNQYVTVYDVARGTEVARVTFREQVSRAFTEDGALFFGERGLFRFDETISLASANKASHVALPVRELPGEPQWFRPGSDIIAVQSDARDRIELLAHAAPAGPLRIDDDHFVATYFRIALGLESKAGGLAWVQANDADFIGGAAFDGGVALCDAAGKVRMFDARTGAAAGSRSLGERVSSCAVVADGFSIAKESLARRPSLAAQIGGAIAVNEPELATIQRVLLREIAKLPDDIGTKVLVDLASNERTSPLLMPDARDELAKRRTGVEYMLQALARHYDFLHDVLTPPPVGPIADALAGMKESRGAGPLASHLNDPADTTDDAKRVALALTVIGGTAELPEIERFFALYRTHPSDDNLVAAVTSAAAIIVRLGSEAQKDMVARAVDDSSTDPAVRRDLQGQLAKAAPKPASSASRPNRAPGSSGTK